MRETIADIETKTDIQTVFIFAILSDTKSRTNTETEPNTR